MKSNYDDYDVEELESESFADEDIELSNPTPKAKKVIRTIAYVIFFLGSLALVFTFAMIATDIAGKEIIKDANFTQKIFPIVALTSFLVALGAGFVLAITGRRGIALPIVGAIFALLLIVDFLVILPAADSNYPQIKALVEKVSQMSFVKKNENYLKVAAFGLAFVSYTILSISASSRRPKRISTVLLGLGLGLMSFVTLAETIFYGVSLVDSVAAEVTKPDVAKWINLGRFSARGFATILFTFAGLFGVFAARKD